MNLTSFGMALIVFAAALGMGWIGSRAMDATARQPQVAGDIRLSMIIIAAFLEGATLLALVLAFINAM